MENDFPPKFIVSKKPKEIRKQGLRLCGAFSTTAILEAYSKIGKIHPKDLCSWWKVIVPPPSLWVNVLNKYGLNAKLRSAKNLSDDEKINLLKKLLSEDKPVMLLIGNGYFRGKYSGLRGRLIDHWITLWGYDHNKKVFYIYDSAVPKDLYDEVPTGNKKRTYKEVLRDWYGGLFASLWGRYVYIELGH